MKLGITELPNNPLWRIIRMIAEGFYFHCGGLL